MEIENSEVSTTTNNFLEALILSTKNKKEKMKRKKVASNILEQPSIKEKYSHLLNNFKSEIQLPYHFKEILKIFEHLDHFLFLFVHHQKSTFAEPIFTSLKRVLKKKISQKELGQILEVMPGCYDLKWMKNERNRGRYNLEINFPKSQDGKGIS